MSQSKHGIGATVHINVEDINEYAPAFLEPAYVRQVDEGIIRNTDPLDYEKSHNHILSVVAYDCGMKQSAPIMVTIKVNRICKLGWKGIPERVDYAPGSGKGELFPAAQLKLCDVPCNVTNVQSKLTLSTSHIGKGCDRDTYSVQNQRKLCGASSESVELLNSGEWTKTLSVDDGRDSDEMYEFDGVSSAVAIPNTVLNHGLASTFTISTWMKHKSQPHLDKHAKEHILCSADDHKMNRHHYALFVCDNEWHHYAVSVQFPEVQLYVDGSLFKSEKKNPEVIDDWPLHPTKDINTTLTVGACWQGSENKMKHHLRGYLAGLSVLLGQTEKPHVLACLHKCKESLEVPAMELLEPGMELLTNSDLTDLSVEGNNLTNLEVLVKKIGYANSREFPTPGRRNLRLTTSIICEHNHPLKIPPVESYVMVLQAQQPSITIVGTTSVAREYHDFRQGVRVFTDLHITMQPTISSWKHSESIGDKKLDSCVVSVYPSLNPDHETMSIPDKVLTQLEISAKISKDGATLSGSDLLYNYEEALRQIQYTNQKPAYYLNRVFKLVCSEMNGRFLSNEYVQTLTVIHPRVVSASTAQESATPETIAAVHPAHAQIAVHQVEMNPHAIVNHYLESISSDHSASPAFVGGSHVVTVMLVVCVGFLLLLMVVGALRIHSAHHRATQEEIADAEMAWDDSALTITVNPMEQINGSGGKLSGVSSLDKSLGHEDDDGDEDDDNSSDDNSSYHDEDGDSSEEEDAHASSCKVKDLEWDNSTLAI
ncbi:unnamed protein product [Bemisia tabaci]|uniref:Calsyntenin C-terminal domain-containing protein n=1 Tax=Bemisia tabaci TaxID=7038 RepID=A0A9P0A848_BEMTA|nr:unnamed protein product [Bemisia tabaci]